MLNFDDISTLSNNLYEAGVKTVNATLNSIDKSDVKIVVELDELLWNSKLLICALDKLGLSFSVTKTKPLVIEPNKDYFNNDLQFKELLGKPLIYQRGIRDV